MFCVNCGKELKDTARFCPFCGQKIEVPAEKNEETVIHEEDFIDDIPLILDDIPVQPVSKPEPVITSEPAAEIVSEPISEVSPFNNSAPSTEPIAMPAPVHPEKISEPTETAKSAKEKKAKAPAASNPASPKSKKPVIIAASIAAIAAIAVAVPLYIMPSIEYSKAEKAMAEGRYEEAHEIFSGLDFRDSQTERVYDASYAIAVDKMNNGDYAGAQKIFYFMLDFNDSQEMYKQSGFLLADQQVANGEYKQALTTVDRLKAFEGADAKYKECLFAYADNLAESGDYKTALELTDGTDITGYEDKPILYRIGAAENYFNEGRYSEAASTLEPIADKEIDGTPVSEFLSKYSYHKIVDKIEKGKATEADAKTLAERPYMDSQLKIMQICYDLGIKELNNKNYAQAAAMFRTAGNYNGAANQLNECLFLLAGEYTASGDYNFARNIYASLGTYKSSPALKNSSAAQTDSGHNGWYADCASYLGNLSTLTFNAGDTITVKGIAGNDTPTAAPATFVVIIRMPGAPAVTVNCPDLTSGGAIEASAEIPAEASGKGEVRIMLASTGHTLSYLEFKVD